MPSTTGVCTPKMSVEECEAATIKEAIRENTKMQKEGNVVTQDVKDIITVLEEYLICKKLICYGGTAINNILPKSAQFYDRTKDVPDYDFYSPDALNDCIELGDIYYKRGYTEVECKSGVHYNTFKVFVNQIPMADITQLDAHLFNAIKPQTIVISGIHYCPANVLRMNMYLELSRPKGYVDRWDKVFSRLNLLNKHHPLKVDKSIMDACRAPSMYGEILRLKPMPEGDNDMADIYTKIHYIVRDTLMNVDAVFFGSFAASFYLNYGKKNGGGRSRGGNNNNSGGCGCGGMFGGGGRGGGCGCGNIFSGGGAAAHASSTPTFTFMHKYGNFNVFHEDIDKCATTLQEQLKTAGIKNIKTMTQKQVIDMSPETIHIMYEKNVIVSLYRPVACHNYNLYKIAGNELRIATIDTILNFFLLFTYIYPFKEMKSRFLCMTSFLFDLEESHRVDGTGLLKRFSYTCIGEQPTLDSMRREKAEKIKELGNDRDSIEYKRWFLKYTPSDADSKTASSSSPKNTTRKFQQSRGYSKYNKNMPPHNPTKKYYDYDAAPPRSRRHQHKRHRSHRANKRYDDYLY